MIFPKVGDLYRWADNNEGKFLMRLIVAVNMNGTTFEIIILNNYFKRTSIGADMLCEYILKMEDI